MKDIYEMELGLTTKEFEIGKKYFPKPSTKFTRPTPRPILSWEDEDTNEPIIPEKSDVANWRKFQKDKSRIKKDRRKHLKKNNEANINIGYVVRQKRKAFKLKLLK